MKRKTAHSTIETNPEVTAAPAAGEGVGTTGAEAVTEAFAASEGLQAAESGEVNAMQTVEASCAEETVTAEPAAESSSAKILPALGKSFGKAIYGTFYFASYGAVFGTLMVARLLPMNNLVGRAIKEGARDAMDALQASAEADATAATMEDEGAVLNA